MEIKESGFITEIMIDMIDFWLQIWKIFFQNHNYF